MENNNYGEVDPAWGEHVFQAKKNRRIDSLFDNQNIRHPPRYENCAVKIVHNENRYYIESASNLSLKVFIEGGSDAPQFRLRLTVGDSEKPDLVMDATFLPWSHHGGQMRPAVDINQDRAAQAVFTFSDRMRNVRFEYAELPVEILTRYAHLFGRSLPAKLSWEYQAPICHNFDFQVDEMSDGQRERVTALRASIINFKRVRDSNKIEVLTKASKKLVESYNFFVGQPCPTPPHFHRWAVRQAINERAVEEFPALTFGGPIMRMFRKQVPGSNLYQPSWSEPIEAVKLPVPIRYLDERQYEVFQMGSLMRDIQFEEMFRTQNNFNGSYDFDFKPVLTHDYVSDRSYLVRLNVRSKSELPLLPPEAGTIVELQLMLGGISAEFLGKVIPSPTNANEHEISMILTRRGGGTGFVFEGHKGRFRFGARGAQYVQFISCIRRVMYGGPNISRDNWLKRLLLAHNPQAPLGIMNIDNDAESYLHGKRCNEMQSVVFHQVVSLGQDGRRLTICQGPAGTGKSHLNLLLTHYFLEKRVVFLVTAASNGAVDVNASRLLEYLISKGESTDGIYRIMPDVLETIFSNPDIRRREDREDSLLDDDVAEGSLMEPSIYNVQPDIDPGVIGSLRSYLNTQLTGTDMDRFSLVRHILSRLTDLASDWVAGMPQDEIDLLRSLLDAKMRVEDWGPLSDTEDVAPDPIKSFNSIWLRVQKYYLQRARGVFLTASMAGSRACRVIPVQCVLLDEASQIKEAEALNAIVRHLPTLRKVVLLGDHKQLPPTIISAHISEFGDSAKLSLMHRMILAGHAHTMLVEQHRMHPHIADIVNELFYEKKLKNGKTVFRRENASLFGEWASWEGLVEPRQALFISVEDPVTMFKEAGGFSKCNPTYIHAVLTIIESMRNFGIPLSEILLITFYAAQKRCYDRLFKARGISVRTFDTSQQIRSVDASQGRQAAFVILDCVSPGGNKYTLGFLKDLQRLNVALSRAEDGLVIVGSEGMTRTLQPNTAVMAWTSLIRRLFKDGGGISKRFGDDGEVRRVLGVPGRYYELAQTRQGYRP